MKLFRKKKLVLPNRRMTVRDNNTTTSNSLFVRNRTLTGTTSNHLASVNVKSGLESPRTQAHHLTMRRRRVFYVLAIALASAAALWLLISNFTASVVVSTPQAEIVRPVNNERYIAAIQQYLAANPIGRLQLLLDQAAMSAYVASKEPEVASVVQIGMDKIGQTAFVVKLRNPVAGWVIDGKQYYVDSNGISFEKNYFAPPIVQVLDESGAASSTAGTAIVSKKFLGFVGRVVSASNSSGYSVIKAVLPSNTTRELVITIKDKISTVKLTIDRSVGEQIEDMSRALQYFARKGQSPAYIDVRVSGKAFYK